MKKIVMVLLAALFAWAVAQPAEAGHERGGAFLLGLGLGILLVPPLIHAASPPVVYEPHYPPPPAAKYGRYDNPRPRRPGCQGIGQSVGMATTGCGKGFGFRDTGDIIRTLEVRLQNSQILMVS